jgi:hypothetical protein
MFSVVTVPEDAPDLTEQVGTKPKFWYKGSNSIDHLFKEARPGTGEDWAEKVASELFALTGIPHVKYDLAVWKNKRGAICPNFSPTGYRFVHGNELLARVVPAYPAMKFYGVKQYTLRRVLAIVGFPGLIQSPIGWETLPVRTPIEVFVGYLMMDAWIGNQDRHHENWGFIVTPGSTIHLAPSYDHASSLGSHENDDNRSDRLTTGDRRRSMEQYVSKALSAFYASSSAEKPLSTVEAFIEAGRMKPGAADAWLSQLEPVSSSETRGILEQIPPDRISPVGIDFAQKILELNRLRLLTLKGRFR